MFVSIGLGSVGVAGGLGGGGGVGETQRPERACDLRVELGLLDEDKVPQQEQVGGCHVVGDRGLWHFEQTGLGVAAAGMDG